MLELRKKGNKHWLLIDDEIGEFTPSKFTINRLNNVINVVYFNNLKSKEYNVSDCYIFDIDDTSGFNTSNGVAFMDKLEELNCPCFQKDVNNFYISGGAWGDITGTLSNQTDLQTALDSKLDKVSTAGVERAYIVNADGSQGTKATSEFKDVLEFADLAAFPVTGESGKIYVAVDTNKTYRWSGSAYVQIGGGSELDIFNPYQNGYYVRGIYPITGLTTFILSGINNTWSNLGTAEAYSTYEEFALTGSKSAVTPGKSCGFTTTGSVRSLFYDSQKNNALISSFIFRNTDASFVSDARFFVGYYAQGLIIGNVNPSTLANCIGFGADSGDSNIQLIHNDQNGTATKIDLGVDFPANTSNVDTYKCDFFIDYPNKKAFARITRLNTGNTTGTIEINSNIFLGAGTGYDPWCWRNNGSTGLEVKIRIGNYLLAQKTR